MSKAAARRSGKSGSTPVAIRSPGGIEAWLVEEHSVPLVAMDFAFIGGSTCDPDGMAGAASMLSDLLDEGAGPYDSQAFQQRLDDMAIELHFGARHDVFGGSLKTLAKFTREAFGMLKLALNEPRLDTADVERVRAQVIAGLKYDLNEPASIASKSWSAKAFAGHPYALPGDGTLESVAGITRGGLAGLRKSILARSNLKAAIVGAIDARTAAAMLDEVFGGLPASASAAPSAAPRFHGVGEQQVIDLDVPQSTIRFGAPGLKRDDPDFIAAVIGNHILGGGSFTSRLWQEVREKRGLAYSVGTALQPMRQIGLFAGSTATSNERAMQSVNIIQSEIKRFLDKGPTRAELEKARKYLKGSYALRFDTSTKIAGELVAIQLNDLGIDYPARHTGLIEAVTMADCRRASERLLGKGELLTTIVGRPAKA